MALEWLGMSITGVVAVVGLVATYRTAKQSREQAERLALLTYQHQRQLAQDARTQERIGDAYLRLLVMAEQIGAWAEAVKPFMDTIPPRPVPEFPAIGVLIEIEATVKAYASIGVRAAACAWRDVVGDMVAKVQLIDMESDALDRDERRHVDFGSPRQQLADLRPKEKQMRARLVDHIAAELGHRPIVAGGVDGASIEPRRSDTIADQSSGSAGGTPGARPGRGRATKDGK